MEEKKIIHDKILFFPKIFTVFFHIDGKKSLYDIHKKTDITYSHLWKIIRILIEETQLLEIEKVGRKKILSFTKEGEKLKNQMLETKKIIDNYEIFK